MNLRQTRRHFYGNSNADYKADIKEFPQTTLPPPKLSHYESLKALAQPKKKTFDQILQMKESKKAAPEIMEKTQSFYNETKKSIKMRANLSRPRYHQLEEHELRKPVFTGDSYYAYDANPEIKTRKSPVDTKAWKGPSDSLAAYKDSQNRHASMETQPVPTHMLNEPATVGNGVDLKKVQEIRGVLRRRYLKSRNFQRIFNFWDMDHKGLVSAQNMYDMCKRLGINANAKECEVVLATADRRGFGGLGPDEFLDLIYNDVDVMGFRPLNKKTSTAVIEEHDVEALKQHLVENAKKQREIKRENQVKFVLRNHMKVLEKEFTKADDGTGTINLFNFERVLKSLNISENVMDSKDVAKLFDHFARSDSTRPGHNKVAFKQFCDQISRTEFEPDTIYQEAKVAPNAMESLLKEDSKKVRMFVKKLRDLDQVNDKISFFDNKLMPAHNLNLLTQKMLKMKRFLGNYFPEESQFVDYMSKSLGIDGSQLSTTNVSQPQFKGFIQGLLDKVGQTVDKRILEGFFGNFNYNTRGQVNAAEIVKTIFRESEAQFYDKIIKRPKGPPPTYNDDMPAVVPLSEQEVKLRKLMEDPNPNPKTLAPTESDLVQRLDDKLFIGEKPFLKQFKEFDVDHDGYVSNNDIRSFLVKQNWMKTEEVEKFISYVDPGKAGVVPFKEFHKKIRRNMANWDENLEQKVRNIMQPSGEHTKFRQSEVLKLSQTLNMFKSQFRPDTTPNYGRRVWSDPDPLSKTRYSHTPAWGNTFTNFQYPSNSSPMYLPDVARLKADNESRTSYQVEERAKKEQALQARLAVKRSNSEQILLRIQAKEEAKDTRQENKLLSKGVANMVYNHKTNLTNRLEFY